MSTTQSASTSIPRSDNNSPLIEIEEQSVNEKKFQQLLLDHFPGVVLLLRAPTREVVISNQAGKDLGVVCGSTCFKTWGQRQDPCPWCLAQELWTTGAEQIAIIEADDKVFEAHWVPFTTDLYLHYSFDITDRIRGEKKLQEQENVIQQALSISHSFTFDWDTATDLVSRSSSCKHIFGNDYAGLANATATRYCQSVHPDDQQQLKTLLYTLTPSSDTYTTDYRLVLSDKSVVTLEETAQAFFDDTGTLRRVIGVAVDISKRKQVEEKNRVYRATLDAALSSMTDAVFISNTVGEFIDFNDAFATFHRFRNKAECAKKLSDYPDIIDVFMESGKLAPLDMWAVPRALQGETVTNAEYSLRRKDTGETWVGSYSFGPIRDKDGLIVGSVVVGRDIAEHKREEQEIRNLTERISTATRSAHVGIWDWDVQNDHLVWDDQMYALYGLSRDQFSGAYEAWIHGLHPDDRAICDEETKRALRGEKNYDTEFRILRPDGATHYLKARGDVIRDTEGKPLRMIGVNYDITDRKRTEEQLIHLTQRLQLATSSAQLGVWDWNVKLNTMDWDDRMFELYGITRETFPHSIEAWLNGLHPDDKEKALAECQAALSGENHYDTAFRIRHPDGTERHLKANGLVIKDANGMAERMIGINADITDMIRAEESKSKLERQLQQAQKMESVGRLAGGVAHDFNNMLSIILGYSHLALMEIDPTHPLHAYIEEILNATNRSTDLTRQLLAFARKQTIEPRVLMLNDTVSGMLKMLQRLIGEDIHLSWHPAPSLWPVNVDPSQVDQILANLCVNARDAIADVGKITIETANHTFDTEYCSANFGFTPGNFVQLAVSDDGCGMDSITLEQIFEPFFTTKGASKGTGLGLSTVYGIVKQNRGFIKVYSEPDQGTTFKIFLPRYEGDTVQTLDKGTTKLLLRGEETILLVEDEISILKMTAQLLEKHGYTVLAADTPNEAIRLANKHDGKIGLLMTDVVMPEMNGRELANNLKKLCPQMKCLFMSGYTANVIAHHGVLDKGVHFIHKPFSVNDLTSKVREVLDGL